MRTRMYTGIFVLLISFVAGAKGQTSTFTYQGRLTDAAVAANGTYQMTFSLFDALSGGTQQGTTITNNAVTVANGVFTVQLDFTAAPFATGANRWIEIAVKKPGDPGFMTLTPRQAVTTPPFSTRAASSGNADNLGGLAASTYLQTNGNASALTNLNAANISTGTVGAARLGSGTANSTTFLRGDDTWAVPSPPASSNYVYAYDTTDQTVVNASILQDVTYNTNSWTNGWSHTAGTSGFTCQVTGLYLVQYYGRFSLFPSNSVSTVSMLATKDGGEVSGSQSLTTFNTVSGNASMAPTVSKSFIISATAGQVLKIRWASSNASTLMSGGSGSGIIETSTTLTITRVP